MLNLKNKISIKTKITSNLLNKKLLIYNGKNYCKLLIIQKMIGYKIGEFFLTRKKQKVNE